MGDRVIGVYPRDTNPLLSKTPGIIAFYEKNIDT